MTTTNTSEIKHAKNSGAYLGVIVSWDFGAGDHDSVQIRRNAVSLVFNECLGAEAAKIHNFEEEITLEEAVDRTRRAGWSARVGTTSKVKIEKLQTNDGAHSYGVMVKAYNGVEDEEYVVGARVRVVGDQADVYGPVGSSGTPAGNEEAERVAQAIIDSAHLRVDFAYNSDIFEPLLRMVKHLGAIPLRRNAGGAYFLANGESTDRFILLLDKLEALTHDRTISEQFHAGVSIVYDDPRNLKTWERNTQIAFDADVEELRNQLVEMTLKTDRTIRDSTWEKKRAECQGLLVRAQTFSRLLGQHLPTIEQAIVQLTKEYGDARVVAANSVDAFNKSMRKLSRMGNEPTPETSGSEPPPTPKNPSLRDLDQSFKNAFRNF